MFCVDHVEVASTIPGDANLATSDTPAPAKELSEALQPHTLGGSAEAAQHWNTHRSRADPVRVEVKALFSGVH